MLLLCLAPALCIAAPGSTTPVSTTLGSKTPVSAPPANVGIDEKLGQSIPLDLRFTDSTGREVTLREAVNGPTLLGLVYFGCKNICPLLMGGMAEVASKLGPDEKFTMLAVSFDPADRPEYAAEARRNYTASLKTPPERWLFLTGSAESIAALTESVGFRYEQRGDMFSHTAALVALSPEGKIVRYLYGVSFLPFDVKMALSEAAEGKVGGVSRKVLLYCFSYDPEGRGYVLNLLKVVGTVMIVIIVLLFIFLMKKPKGHAKGDSGG